MSFLKALHSSLVKARSVKLLLIHARLPGERDVMTSCQDYDTLSVHGQQRTKV